MLEWVRSSKPGDMVMLEVPKHGLRLQSAAFVASSTGVNLEAEFGGARSFFGGEGMFLISATAKVTYPEDADAERKELVPTYNRAGALEAATLDGVTYVDRIAYNARGQKLFVACGNGVMTRYAYDPETFRLARLRSREYTKTGTTYAETGTRFQDNGYAYDLTGNILGVLDRSDVGGELANTDATTVIDGYGYGIPTSNTFHRQYTYDPTGRFLSATGAVHD